MSLRLLPLALILVACDGRVAADQFSDDTDAPPDGRIALWTTSSAANAETDYLSMDLGRVEIRLADDSGLRDQWLVVDEDAGEVRVIEATPAEYLIGESATAAARYDAIRVEIPGGTYANADGDGFTLDPPEGLPISGKLTIDTVFCVDFGFDLDAIVDDHSSC